jgi:hypothetical protein
MTRYVLKRLTGSPAFDKPQIGFVVRIADWFFRLDQQMSPINTEHVRKQNTGRSAFAFHARGPELGGPFEDGLSNRRQQR